MKIYFVYAVSLCLVSVLAKASSDCESRFSESLNEGVHISNSLQKQSGLPTYEQESAPKISEMEYVRQGTKYKQIFYTNKFGQQVTVMMKDDKIDQVTWFGTINPDAADEKRRDYTVINEAFWVKDSVLPNDSANRGRLFHFVGKPPQVHFDKDQNLIVKFGNDKNDEFIKLKAKDFSFLEGKGFSSGSSKVLIQNGTRSLPNFKYTGDGFYLLNTYWSYPPEKGRLDLMKGQKKYGSVDVSTLYRVVRLGGGDFEVTPKYATKGLEKYLSNSAELKSTDDSMKTFIKEYLSTIR